MSDESTIVNSAMELVGSQVRRVMQAKALSLVAFGGVMTAWHPNPNVAGEHFVP